MMAALFHVHIDDHLLVKEAVEKTGASSPKDMGKVMGMLMPKVKGRADGKMVNTIVRSMLQG